MSANLSPLDPRAPEGWRRLGLDETLQAGDMFGYSDNHFEFTIVNALAGKTVREIGVHDEPNWVLAYRAPLVNPSPKGAGDLDQYEKEAPIFDALMIELRGSWPQYEHYANLLNEARGFRAREGDGVLAQFHAGLYPLPVVADAARPRKALADILAKCEPHVLRSHVGKSERDIGRDDIADEVADIAREALAAQPASGAEAEQSPSSPVALECMVLFNEKNISQAVCNLEDHSYYHPLLDDRPGWRWVRMVPAALPTDAPAPSSPVDPRRDEVLRHTVKALRQLGRHFHADDLKAVFPEVFGAALPTDAKEGGAA